MHVLLVLAAITAADGTGPSSQELKSSIFSKLEYDLRYFESVDKLASRGQKDVRFSSTEWPREVARARVNLPVLRQYFTERASYLAGSPLRLPKNDATFRVYANLGAILNMVQARDLGQPKEMVRLGQKVSIDSRENLGKVVGDKADYYLGLYREFYFLMAEALYRLGQDDDAVKWFARIQADADIQKLQAQMKKQSMIDPRTARLNALRTKPVALLPFDAPANDRWMGQGLLEVLSADLMQLTDLLLVERTQLDKVLKEAELAQLSVTMDSPAAELGKKLFAGTILTGVLSGEGPAFSLEIKLIATEDAVTLATKKGDHRSPKAVPRCAHARHGAPRRRRLARRRDRRGRTHSARARARHDQSAARGTPAACEQRWCRARSLRQSDARGSGLCPPLR